MNSPRYPPWLYAAGPWERLSLAFCPWREPHFDPQFQYPSPYRELPK